jgi:hypothetical protein
MEPAEPLRTRGRRIPSVHEPRMTDEGIVALRRAVEALGSSDDAGDRETAAAARHALEELQRTVDWRDRLLSDEVVEAVAGELFAQDASEAIRDARGGWHKDRLRRAARSLLIAGADAAEPQDGPAAG